MNAYKSVIDDPQLSKTNAIAKNSILAFDNHSVAIPRRELKLDAAKVAKAQADARFIMQVFGK